MKPLASSLSSIVSPVLGKRGLGEAQIVTHWAAIVGAELAARSLPTKLVFAKGQRQDGTLHLRVAGAAALEIQHREPQIIERVNGFAGYHMVGRLALTQGPLPVRRAPPRRQPRALAPAEGGALDQRLAPIDDAELRAALRRLGEAIIGSDNPPPGPGKPGLRTRR